MLVTGTGSKREHSSSEPVIAQQWSRGKEQEKGEDGEQTH